LATIFGIALLLSAVSPGARAVDVSNLSDIEADPCFQQAHQRALGHQLGVIESQIVAACTDAHGNPTDAMALLTERAKAPPWLPPASGGMSATGALLAALAQLAVVVALLGVDVGYAARAIGLPPQSAAVASGLVAARLIVALALTALAALPGMTILAAVGLLLFAARMCRWLGPLPPAGPSSASGLGAAGRIALLGTDLFGNAVVTLGIAAASRGSLALAGGGVLVAVPAARLLHPMLSRLLTRRPTLARGAGALVAWVAGLAALSDQAMPTFDTPATLALSAVPAALVVLAAIAGRRRPAIHAPLAKG
jgi:hypothetical protein